MLCLGIETSCDETALALVAEGHLIDEIIASQINLHAIFGGVVPELASREHGWHIPILFDRLMERNNLRATDLDYVAVSRGPGLLGSLLVGVAFAKGLALGLGKPVIGVNHLHSHLLATALDNDLRFPALGIVVSGGHTNIYRMEAPESIIQLGRTLDDAAGEAFDKVGHVLGFAYPAGKKIDDCAQAGCADARLLPRPYLDNDNLDFSFSGLKTAAILAIQELGLENAAADPQKSSQLNDFCASFNLAICETLGAKLERALRLNPDVKILLGAGGVAANSAVRKTLASLVAPERLLIPETGHCTDNAAMVAMAGYLLARRGFYHTLDFETVPRGVPVPQDMARNANIHSI